MNPEDLINLFNNTLKQQDNNQNEVFSAINDYLLTLGMYPLLPYDFTEVNSLIRNDQFVKAIKLVREITKKTRDPVIRPTDGNHVTMDETNELYMFIRNSSQYRHLVESVAVLSLKQAKNIVDVLRVTFY